MHVRKPRSDQGLTGGTPPGLLVALAVGVSLIATSCGGAGDDAATVDADAMTTTSAPEYAPELMRACEPGARGWDGVPIAAFADPSNDAQVVCWADGSVSKSPPPDPDGTRYASFDRVVFTATMDGQVVEMLHAGYRDRMVVTPP